MRRLMVVVLSFVVIVGGLSTTPAQAAVAPAPGSAPLSIPNQPSGHATAKPATTQTATATLAPGGAAYATGDVFAGLDNATVSDFSSTGAMRQSLSTGGAGEQTGMCFDGAGNLYATNFTSANMTKFDNTGALVAYPWAGPFTPGEPESCVVDNHGHVWVGASDSADLREFDQTGNLLGVHHPAIQARGIDWIDLSGDQCTFLYTSEGSSVKAFNACTNTQLADFATGLPGPCFELRILHDGRVAVGCASEVVLLSNTGQVQQTYTTASIGDAGGFLFAFNLTPDNTAFWTADFYTGGIYLIDLATGAVRTTFNAGRGVRGLAVFGGGGPVGSPLTSTETLGGGNPDEHSTQCQHGPYPVNCATGDFWHTFGDLSVPGRGIPLNLTRTYNSLSAATGSPFGFGWSASYTMHLSVEAVSGAVTVTQENGATNLFTPIGGGAYSAPPRVLATMVKNGDGTFTFTRLKRQVLTFAADGRLLTETDLNGVTTALGYDTSNRLVTVTDAAGRALTFSYGSNGKIATATDPAARIVAYGYDSSGNLTTVTDPNGKAWTFGYSPGHLLMSMTDPRGGVVANVYDSTARVTKQTDPLNRATSYAYTSTGTTITDPKGNVTVQGYTAGELTTLTRGQGTAAQATWQYAYDQYTLGVTALTDPNGHITRHAYDPDGNLSSSTDANAHVTSLTYNNLDEPLTITDPAGTTTTYTYDSAGNPLSVARPLTGTSTTQTSTFGYGDSTHPGDVTSRTDPNGKVWASTYDTYGDLVSGTDPLGDKATFGYDTIGRRTSATSPRGNVTGANPATYTTSYGYNPFGDVTTITDPLGHLTSFGYDQNRNRTSVTDPNLKTTTTTYNGDNEPTAVRRADTTTLAYGYDGAGNQTTQTDAASHTTSYTFDPLNRLATTVDPLNRTTAYGYDAAGNLTTSTDPAGRVTTIGHDPANQVSTIGYSDGRTPAVAFTYTADGQQATMVDGTGTTTNTYDSLNRLTNSTNGAGQHVGYGYDLASHLT